MARWIVCATYKNRQNPTTEGCCCCCCCGKDHFFKSTRGFDQRSLLHQVRFEELLWGTRYFGWSIDNICKVAWAICVFSKIVITQRHGICHRTYSSSSSTRTILVMQRGQDDNSDGNDEHKEESRLQGTKRWAELVIVRLVVVLVPCGRHGRKQANKKHRCCLYCCCCYCSLQCDTVVVVVVEEVLLLDVGLVCCCLLLLVVTWCGSCLIVVIVYVVLDC